MKHFDRLALLLSLGAAFIALLLAVGEFISHRAPAPWVNCAGLLFQLSGIFQLEVSGLFSKLLEAYGNTSNHPFGAPSHITRKIIDNPDRPFATYVRNLLFFRVRTGFWLVVLGTALQLAAVWL